MESELQLLVIEDDPLDAKAVRRMLIKGGVLQKSDSAASLAEAKEKIRSRHFDAVILDLGLPDSQGVDSVIDFQASAPELPIVVLTGSHDESSALRALDIGAEDYISKDNLQPEALLKALRFAVERHRRKRQLFRDMDSLRVSLDDALLQACTDSLTGLPNRRGLNRYLGKLETDKPVIVGVADLDSFAAVNDSHGHSVGDAVLKEFAARLQQCLRTTDFAARVGGDEFVVVFDALERAEAAALAGRIISSAAAVPALGSAGQPIPFTATMAMAELRPPFLDIEQILLGTHKFMSQGKSSGKNQVLCAWNEGEPARPAAAAAREAAPSPGEEPLSLEVRPLKPLGATGTEGYHLSFNLGPLVRPLLMPALSQARLGNRLGDMTLECLRLAQAWRHKEAPGAQMHLDVDAGAFKPSLCAELGGIFRTTQDRNGTVLFFTTDFPSKPGGGYVSGLRLLRQAGFQLGVRSLGLGSTNFENLLLIRPEWLRLDAGLTAYVGRFEEKSRELALVVEMLRPLGARLAAEEISGEEDLKVLERMGFSAAYASTAAQLPGGAERRGEA